MLRTYSKRRARMEMCPGNDQFDQVVSRDSTKNRTGNTSNITQDLQKKPLNRSSNTGTSEYTLTWTYTYETDGNLVEDNVSPIETPRRESHGVPDALPTAQDILSPILPQVQDEATEKVTRWLEHGTGQSPCNEEQYIGPRHNRMNSTLMDNSLAQNAEDAMKHLQGISTIYEGEDVLFGGSPLELSKRELKRIKRTLETTPPVQKSAAKPEAPTKAGTHQGKRKGSLLPKNPAMIFGEELQEDVNQGRGTMQPPSKLKLLTDSLNKLERIDEMDGSNGQISPRWTSLHELKKTVAKTSTPAKLCPTTCDDMNMFSVELSSVNPSNETGVELQLNQSRFVNSKEVVHDSDYLTPDAMRNETDELQNRAIQEDPKLAALCRKISGEKTSREISESFQPESKRSKMEKSTRTIDITENRERANSDPKVQLRSHTSIKAVGKGTSSEQQPKATGAKTSTPANRGPATSGDQNMFSVDLSSVNPSNETGAGLQSHQSRFVNSSEVVHDSDYLTPKQMNNEGEATKKSHNSSIKTTGTSIKGENKANGDEQITRNSENFTKLLLPDQTSSEVEKTGQRKKDPIPPETKRVKHITSPRLRKQMSKVSEMGHFPRIKLRNSSQSSRSRRKVRDTKARRKRQPGHECTKPQEFCAAEKEEPAANEDQMKRQAPGKSRSSPLTQESNRSVVNAPLEVSSPEIQRCMSISIDMAKTPSVLETVGLDASPPAANTRRSSQRKSVTFTGESPGESFQIKKLLHWGSPGLDASPPVANTRRSSQRKLVTFTGESPSFQIKPISNINGVPVCCLSLLDEPFPKKTQIGNPLKVDYNSLCTTIPVDCLTLFDEER